MSRGRSGGYTSTSGEPRKCSIAAHCTCQLLAAIRQRPHEGVESVIEVPFAAAALPHLGAVGQQDIRHHRSLNGEDAGQGSRFGLRMRREKGVSAPP